VVARDRSDTPTEHFVPEFDDDLSGDGHQDPGVPENATGSSDDPSASTGDAPGAVASVATGLGAGSGETGDPMIEPERGGSGSEGDRRPVVPVAPAELGSGSDVGSSGVSLNNAGPTVADRPTDWRRPALIAVLVLCTAAAGILTGYAAVRATAAWTVTWGGSDQAAVQPPAVNPSPSATQGGNPDPQRPWPTVTASPTLSASDTPEPTSSVQPSRSPKPRTTPTSVNPVPPSSPPGTADPTPSATRDADG
jgi:hypothetical protein